MFGWVTCCTSGAVRDDEANDIPVLSLAKSDNWLVFSVRVTFPVNIFFKIHLSELLFSSIVFPFNIVNHGPQLSPIECVVLRKLMLFAEL
jgi:hypothetical protein